ncbi:alpha/beta fold hydrolase [Nocardia altamirensis]|uniref:alpha/beta fold hydrolase n=1 Tax=Nocardia altamirensis TaxID=472158 RepID=UPI0008404C16|nr:alpha/beta hydrolase [Nocardia altamirensis]
MRAALPASGSGETSRRLRTRIYATAAFNPPTVACDVVPVTTSDGIRLRVHAYGPADGDVLVLIHGWSCCIEYWNPQINASAGTYRVIAYDLRGHGESELGDAALTVDLLVDDLVAVLAATLRPGRRAVLVGHSLGGMLVQAWAGSYPEQVPRCASAVLLANTAAGDLVTETTVLPPFNRGWLKLPRWLARAVSGSSAPIRRNAVTKWLFRHRILSPAASADAVDFVMAITKSCPGAARSKTGLLLTDLELGRSAVDLTVPTTLTAGAYDHLIPVTQAERLAEMLREAGTFQKLVVLPTGHTGTLEAHEEFNTALAEVLATNAVRGTSAAQAKPAALRDTPDSNP